MLLLRVVCPAAFYVIPASRISYIARRCLNEFLLSGDERERVRVGAIFREAATPRYDARRLSASERGDINAAISSLLHLFMKRARGARLVSDGDAFRVSAISRSLISESYGVPEKVVAHHATRFVRPRIHVQVSSSSRCLNGTA